MYSYADKLNHYCEAIVNGAVSQDLILTIETRIHDAAAINNAHLPLYMTLVSDASRYRRYLAETTNLTPFISGDFYDKP